MLENGSLVEGSAERSTLKQRAAVQREVTRLLNDLAPERPPPTRELPDVAVRQHRAPGRCILQGHASAVSVSWFPPRADEATLGEIMVIAWQGTVSLPGAAPRRADAVALEQHLFHPVEAAAGAWEWAAVDRDTLDTPSLATYCRDLLQS